MADKILIVDDVEDNVKLLSYDLLDEGYQILTALNGYDAIKIAKKELPDLILLDIMMPGIDGIDTGIALKKAPETRDIPVILLSAKDTQETITQGLDGGAHDFISKPYNSPIVFARIHSALRVKHSRDILRSANQALMEAKAQADEANAAKSRFLSSMSHEIRTPMTAILGYIDLILAPDETADNRNNYLSIVKNNADHLLSIINAILDISKVEADMMSVEKINTSIILVIEDCINLLKIKAHSKGIFFRAKYNFPLPAKIKSDPLRLRQVILNILSNAIKFTETGGVTLELDFETLGSGATVVRIDVIDSGIGMTETQIKKLFQPFTQATTETTRQFGGTGLGMTISKKLAKLLGGDLVVSSIYGEGSTFSFSFKFDEVHDTAIFKSLEDYRHSIDNSVRQKSGQFFLGRVLLVEDNKANQLLISKILISLGLSVEKADNGQLACTRVLESEKFHNPYDLIFMDMYMPIMGGLEATEELRKQDFKRPIIALTANVSNEDQQECLKAGCDDILGKPLVITDLKKILLKYLTCSTKATNINS